MVGPGADLLGLVGRPGAVSNSSWAHSGEDHADGVDGGEVTGHSPCTGRVQWRGERARARARDSSLMSRARRRVYFAEAGCSAAQDEARGFAHLAAHVGMKARVADVAEGR